MASPEEINIPQKPPMVMVDRLLSAEGKKTVTSLRIRDDNIFVEEGYFMEPGLIENMAQTAAAGVGYLASLKHRDPPVGFIGGIKNLAIHDLPKSGQEIKTEITVEHEVMNATVATGKIYLKDKLLASCELKIFLLEKT
jgi:3-hydroxyacyl-[acyl-carrier-protein] dehydratase